MTTTPVTIVLDMDSGTALRSSAARYTELNFLSCACQEFFPIHTVIDSKLKYLIQW